MAGIDRKAGALFRLGLAGAVAGCRLKGGV
jgi:hypothetical protein